MLADSRKYRFSLVPNLRSNRLHCALFNGQGASLQNVRWVARSALARELVRSGGGRVSASRRIHIHK
jgi:hypothetical protein